MSIKETSLETLAFRLGTEEYGIDIAGRVIGMVADSVSDVMGLGPEDVRPAPSMGTVFATDFCSVSAPLTNAC